MHPSIKLILISRTEHQYIVSYKPTIFKPTRIHAQSTFEQSMGGSARKKVTSVGGPAKGTPAPARGAEEEAGKMGGKKGSLWQAISKAGKKMRLSRSLGGRAAARRGKGR